MKVNTINNSIEKQNLIININSTKIELRKLNQKYQEFYINKKKAPY